MARTEQAVQAKGGPASARPVKKAAERGSQAESNKLYVGEGVTIRGEITVPETIIVDGLLEGDVKTHRLIIGLSGIVKGKVAVSGNADVYGKTIDHLEVKNLLVVRSTGSIEGNVSYGELLIERGGSIAGGISSADYKPTGDGAKPVSNPVNNGRKPARVAPPKDKMEKMRKRLFPSVPYVSASQAKAQSARVSGGESKGKRDGEGNG